MRRFLGVLVAVALGGGALAQTPPNHDAALAAVDRIYATEAAAHPIGAMTVGVVDHGKLVWTKSYGFADMEKQVPATRRTVYRIGSITKQFTGVALLQLVAAGKVKLDDPALTYVPELASVKGFDHAETPVTLLSLATHRAGLTREPDGAQFWTGPIDQWQSITRDALTHTRLIFKVNDQGVYSNIGYATLGLALEKASGAPYTELVEGGVIRPLDMTSTSFRPDAEMLSRLAKGYATRGGHADAKAAEKELVDGRGYKIPNGGLFTTVDDLARFMAFEMGHGPARVLSPDVLKQNFARSYPLSDDRYGVGFTLDLHGDQVLIGHAGGVAGYTSSAFFDPKTQIGIICLRGADYGCEGLFQLEALAALAPSWGEIARAARHAEDVRAKRFADQKPYPTGEAALRRVIGELQRGQPDYTRMDPDLVATLRTQLASMQARLAPLGALQSVSFKGVGPGGADIYEVAFAAGKLEWRITLGEDGVVEALTFRPLT